ncbi:MAG: sensor histidine kinase N-terminal domain-containing protein [Hyphomicrobiales bacterium]|nr:sensor histidine kinase N-terminal domain-containing protein [Hyphomicrobiales bacterium]
MRSLRASALAGATTLLLAVGAASLGIVYFAARGEAAAFLDGQLRQVALNAGSGVDGARDAPDGVDPQDSEDALSVWIWRADGSPVRGPDGGPSLPRLGAPGYATVVAAGERWRAFVAEGSGRTVQVAQRVAVRDKLARETAAAAAVPLLVALPLLWALSLAWAAALSRRLGRVATAIGARDLEDDAPLAGAGVPREIAPLVSAMDALAGRLREALGAQRRFVADAAHELRTPLAALQIQVDNLAAESPDSAAPAISDLRRGVARASGLVASLLRLARLEGAPRRKGAASVDLAEAIRAAVADATPVADARGVELALDAVDAAPVRAEVEDLRAILDNFLDNAVKHCPPGGAVEASLSAQGGVATATVRDEGPGVPEAELPQLFERFRRGSRRASDGAGLGLAIAAAAAARHGMSIDLANRPDRPGLVATLRAPLVQPDIRGTT